MATTRMRTERDFRLKRLFDVLLSVTALLLISPILLFAALGVKFTSKGPILYRARRVGRNGKTFSMFKFRTMRVDSDRLSSITSPNDQRIFRFGQLLRQLKIDELPQLWNILIGDMSFVGPRPEDPKIVSLYYRDWMLQTLSCAPGVTGPGSIYGYIFGDILLDDADPEGSYVRNLLEPKLALELAYLERASFSQDLSYIFLTGWAIVAYVFGLKVQLPLADIEAARRWAAQGPYTVLGSNEATHVISKLIGLSRATKRTIQVFVDAILLVFCFYLAMLLRLEERAFLENIEVWLAFVPTIPVTIFAFVKLGLYRSVLRFITGEAFRAIATGTFFSGLTLFLMAQFFSAPIPHSVPIIYSVLLVGLIGGIRFLMRNVFRMSALSNRLPIVIYGAGEAGRQLENALFHGQEYAPIAFVDDDVVLHGTLVSGRRVFPPSEIPRLIKEQQIKSVLLALPNVSRARRRDIISQIEPYGIEIKTMPGITDIVSGRSSFNELRHVTPEDLLGRDPVPPRLELMGKNIAKKVVLVSGAGGSIGSELCRQIIKHNPLKLILLEVSEFALYTISLELRETLESEGRTIAIEPVLGSVQNPGRVRAILRAFGVQTIYHAAAYKHVVLVEENVVEGVRNNVFGTKIIAEAAADLGVENFILISTDKAVRPTNFMGASKRMAELVCQALSADNNQTIFSIVRFGNVLGSSGSVIPRFNAQIQKGGPVTVTHREITRYFMTIPEASQLVIQAGAMAKGGDVFVLDMGDPVKILDLAESMIRLHGLKPYIVDQVESPAVSKGDIGIQIVGLNKGEKLYEELLIGDNPRGTEHPRILTATEVCLSRDVLEELLVQLERSCLAFDIEEIKKLFLKAPLAYRPNSSDIHDLMWNAFENASVPNRPRPKAVDQRK